MQALTIIKEDGMYHVVNLINMKTVKIFETKEQAKKFKQKIANWKHVRKFKLKQIPNNIPSIRKVTVKDCRG